ncbi:UDP-2,3-diacylglucosamine diphosphatase [Chromobacterium sp. CV08]|uniref:UDP-2,3-diacylglucosamine diphosphatase n=1 Tax=Chromobacterium sp. CV08 TaxID=3133274 RepID=UPI003DA93B6F
MAIHFISDLHLADDTPALTRLFLDTLAGWRGRIEALYILGDLFEYWVGDDDDSPYLEEALAALRAFAAETPLFVMRGNRDFLFGAGFEARSGARLLDDPTLIEAHGRRILLSHGDALCADDTAYQQFRAVSRSPAWQQAMLARPLAERHAIARHARAQSEMNKQANGLSAISDVTETAVQQLLAAHGWPTLIHGHTHRPGHHRHQAGDSHAERWVIRDWHGEAGGYLLLDDAGIQALPLGG